MIQTEQITINNKLFIRTWSDSDRYVVRDGVEYSEAIDPVEFNRVYTEGNRIVDSELEDPYATAGHILMGEGG